MIEGVDIIEQQSKLWTHHARRKRGKRWKGLENQIHVGIWDYKHQNNHQIPNQS